MLNHYLGRQRESDTLSQLLPFFCRVDTQPDDLEQGVQNLLKPQVPLGRLSNEAERFVSTPRLAILARLTCCPFAPDHPTAKAFNSSNVGGSPQSDCAPVCRPCMDFEQIIRRSHAPHPTRFINPKAASPELNPQ